MMNRIVEHVMCTSRRTWRRLPPDALPLWRRVLNRLSTWNDDISLAAIFVAPAVLLRRTSKNIVGHLSRCLMSDGALEECFVQELDDNPDRWDPENEQTSTVAPVEQVLRHMARECPAKAVRAMEQKVTADFSQPPAQAALKQMFPDHDDPVLLEPMEVVNDAQCFVGAAYIIATAVRRTRKAAAPGLNGWTRELVITGFSGEGPATSLERVVNSIRRNDLPAVLRGLCRVGRVAGWIKDPDKGKYRFVGVTDYLVKLSWKVCLSRVSKSILSPSQLMFVRGGALNGIRWVQQQLQNGRAVIFSDISDAYPRTSRKTLAQVIANEPLLNPIRALFSLSYGAPFRFVYSVGTQVLQEFLVDDGVIPGCAGAALLFALATSNIRHDEMRMFADDVALACEPTHTEQAWTTLQQLTAQWPLAKSKTFIIGGQLRGIPTVPAARYLGAYVGSTQAASALMIKGFADITTIGRSVFRLAVPFQIKFAMLNVLVQRVAWRFGATEPSITEAAADNLDDILAEWLSTLAKAPLTPLARRQSYLSCATGGVGWPCFAEDGKSLFEEFSATLPHAGDRTKVLAARQQRHREAFMRLSGLTEGRMRELATTGDPVHSVLPFSKSLTINDDAYALALELKFRLQSKRSISCPEWSSRPDGLVMDHFLCCRTCTASLWLARHNAVLRAILRVCSKFDVHGGSNFAAVFGTVEGDGRIPDAMFWRSSGGVIVIDLSIVHVSASSRWARGENAALARVRQKLAKYDGWRDDIGITVSPLVITTTATIPPEAHKVLENIASEAPHTGMLRELRNQMLVALVCVQADMLRIASSRVVSAIGER
jgi:hypothetical protein